jgi:hypothetical protein
MHRPSWIVPAFLSGALALAIAGCRNHKTEGPSTEDAGSPSQAGQGSPQGDGPSEALDPGIGEGLPQGAGTMDVTNRYASTLMITADAQARVPACSGVAINPQLVLTAASCVCSPPDAVCAKRSFVTTVLYGAVGAKDFKEATTEKRYHSYEGEVRPHPDFKISLDGQGSTQSSRADLAVILLDKPIEEALEYVPLAKTEIQADEFLIMSGYAQPGPFGGVPGGIRYFRRNKVVDVLQTPQGKAAYAQQGAFIYNGFRGGPCFREAGSRRWLVGIASPGSDKELSFTTVYAFRDWLLDEARHAADAATLPPAPPQRK